MPEQDIDTDACIRTYLEDVRGGDDAGSYSGVRVPNTMLEAAENAGVNVWALEADGAEIGVGGTGRGVEVGRGSLVVYR